MDEQNLVLWPYDADPMTDAEVNDSTRIAAANQNDLDKLASVTIKQIARRAANEVEMTGVDLGPISGGTSAANATVVANGPAGQNRKYEAKAGWYRLNGTNVEATAGKRWLLWWNGSAWSLVDMGALSTARTTIPAWTAGSYSKDEVVEYGGMLYRANKLTTAAPTDTAGVVSPDWNLVGGGELDVPGGALGFDTALAGSVVTDIPTPFLGQYWRGDGTSGGFSYYARSDKFQLNKGDTVSVRSATENLANPAIAVYDLETGRFIPEESLFYEALNVAETNTYTATKSVLIGINYRATPQVGDFKRHAQTLLVKPADIDNEESPVGVPSMASFKGVTENRTVKPMEGVTLRNKGRFNGDGTLNFNAIEFHYTDPIFVKEGSTVTARMRFNNNEPIGSVMGGIFDLDMNPTGSLKTQRRIEPIDATNYRYETTFTAAADCYISVMSHVTNPNAPVIYIEVLAESPNFLAPEHIGQNSEYGVASQREFEDFKNNGGYTELPDSIFNLVGVIKPDGDTTAVYASRYTDFIELRKGQTINIDVAVGEFNPVSPSVIMFVYDNTKQVILQRILATAVGMQSASYTAEETVFVRINHFLDGYNFKQKVTISKPKLYQPYGAEGGGGGTGRYIPDVTRYNPVELIRIDLTTTDPIPTAKGTFMNGNSRIIIDNHEYNFYTSYEVQGSSSAGYPEKNWTIALFTDSTMAEAQKFRVANLLPHDEYVFKANWIEPNHVCNIAANRLWEQMLQTRDSFPKRDTDYKIWSLQGPTATETGALGHVDGFPAVLYINGTLYGIGCFNIGKKYQNYDLTKDDANNTQFELDNQVDLTVLNGIELRNPKTSTPAVVTVLNKFKALASLDISVPANRTLFKDGFVANNIVDAYLLLDYLKLVDCIARNFHWMTYDGGTKFLTTPYDLDSWFKNASGSSIEPPTGRVWDHGLQVPENTKAFWQDKVGTVYQQEIKDRYTQLRNMGIFSADNIYGLCRDLSIKYGRDLYVQDAARWPDKSNWSINILKIADWVRARTTYLDGVYGY